MVDVLKTIRECRADMEADGIYDMADDAIAYDIAASLLEDPEFTKAAKKMWPGKSADLLREIVADRL
jgi:hypothetical protein